MTAEPPHKTQSINGIQYLRGIAALMVVFYHSRSYFGEVPEWTRFGARGVDIFFVISGFIMAYSTQHIGNDMSAAKASMSFFVKRVIRVVPLYWIALLWTSAAFWINWLAASHAPGDLAAHLNPILTSIAKDFAFIPHPSIDDEEDGELFPILIPGWTLNYEMYFYLIFALCLLFRQHSLLLASGILVALVVVGKLYYFQDELGRFYTSSILLEFVFGMMLFHVYAKTTELALSRTTLALFGAVGFLLLNSGSQVNDKLVLAVAATIIAWVFIHAFRGVHNGPLKILGDASYSIYLFHMAAFGIARVIIKYLGFGANGYANIVTIIMIQVAVAVSVGIVVYYVVEKPLLTMLRKRLERVSVPTH